MGQQLRNIWIFPIKSLDGVQIDQTAVTAEGALEHDRQYVLIDTAGQVLRAKSVTALHQIRTQYDLNHSTVVMAFNGGEPTGPLDLDEQRIAIDEWLSDHLKSAVRLVKAGPLPDDPNLLGPTLVSTGSLAAVSEWFGGMEVSDLMRRFRANLVIDAEPFFEDQLAAGEGAAVAFRLGNVELHGAALCPRCPVPARDWRTGELDVSFAEHFGRQREKALPPWADRALFKHYYHLATRTIVPSSEAGKMLRIGDEFALLGRRQCGIPPKRYAKFAERARERIPT